MERFAKDSEIEKDISSGYSRLPLLNTLKASESDQLRTLVEQAELLTWAKRFCSTTKDTNTRSQDPILVLIAGVSGSNKSGFAQKIHIALSNGLDTDLTCTTISMVDTHSSTPENANWDTPTAFGKYIPTLLQTLEKLKKRQIATDESGKTIIPTDVVIVKGIFALHFEELRKLADLKLYIDCDTDTALAKRIIRDTKNDGLETNYAIDRYANFVKPGADLYVRPSAKHATLQVKSDDNEAVVIVAEWLERKFGIH